MRTQEDAVSSPTSIAVADYNGDGLLDIARGMGDGTRGLFQIMHGNGNGTFQPVVRYAAPPPKSSVAGGWMIAADFNGDGKPDVAMEVRGNNAATDVFFNTTGGAVPSAPPTAAALSGQTLNPSSLNGGSAATGTVTLSAGAQSATTVSLTSNSASATVPASVTIPSGATSASFAISTKQVGSTTLHRSPRRRTLFRAWRR